MERELIPKAAESDMGDFPLAVRISKYLATLAPHVREREAATLLAEAEKVIRISEETGTPGNALALLPQPEQEPA